MTSMMLVMKVSYLCNYVTELSQVDDANIACLWIAIVENLVVIPNGLGL